METRQLANNIPDSFATSSSSRTASAGRSSRVTRPLRRLGRETERKPTRKLPHCRKCGLRTKGHTREGCPRRPDTSSRRQRYVRKLAGTYPGMVHAILAPSDRIRVEVEEAEKLGFKTCVLPVEDENSMLLLSEHGLSVLNITGLLLEKSRKGPTRSFGGANRKGRWWKPVHRKLRMLANLVVHVFEKPLTQKMVEKVLLGWLSRKNE